MKLERHKLIFSILILGLLIFIGIYSAMMLGEEDTPNLDSHQIPIPALKEDTKAYESKLDAINDLKEVKQTNAPSIYDERLLDSTGVYDADLLTKEKQRMVDSIYNEGRINYTNKSFKEPTIQWPLQAEVIRKDTMVAKPPKETVSIKSLGLEHQLFFASNPKLKELKSIIKPNPLPVMVDGTQTVKANYRLSMRLLCDAEINGVHIPRYTPVYGFVSFKPNRTLLEIETIDHISVRLKAFDLQDGSEGIYIENSFRANATREVIDDVVQDINIAGVPQVGGIKQLFQLDNRSVKVTILDNYQLLLKTND